MWLPDAMEGPTPVSALLHAATMVTAGVYLVIRFSYFIEFSALARGYLLYSSVMTMFFSSLVAMFQYDIKKIIAYSTCSQLGLMFFAAALGAPELAFFHFFNHSFYKCMLFLLAGTIIHELNNEQDIRAMGGLWRRMPVTALLFLIATLSLCGMPYFSGAVSKDVIFNIVDIIAFSSPYIETTIIFESVRLTIWLTFAYSFRLLYYVFIAEG